MLLALSLTFEMVHPTISFALTEGPSQPEVQSFEPVGTTQMVDLFTGDFNYNIPLFNLPGPNGGYPVNLAYHAGVSMDDEASWVGLGWNLNVGALVRNMRGLPDEFLSHADEGANEPLADLTYDHMVVKSDMKQSWTVGVKGSVPLEVLGGDPNSGSAGLSIYHNNYRGLGVGLDVSIAGIGKSDNFGVGLSLDSENGLGLSANLKHSTNADQGKGLKHSLGVSFDGNLSVSYSIAPTQKVLGQPMYPGQIRLVDKPGNSFSTSMSFARTAFVHQTMRKAIYSNASVMINWSSAAAPYSQVGNSLGGFQNGTLFDPVDKKGRPVLVSGYDRTGDFALSNTQSQYFTRDFSRQNDGQITKESVFLGNSYYTYDTYNSTGQGLSGFFRPRRNDIGRTNDPFVYNTTTGFSAGFNVGAGNSNQLVGNVGVNWGWESVGPWKVNNDLSFDFTLTSPEVAPDYHGIKEVVYYKAHGEQTMYDDTDIAYLDGLGLAEVKLKPKNNDGLAGKRKIDDTGSSFDNDAHAETHRFARNTLIHELKNKEVHKLGEFKIKHYKGIPSEEQLFSDPSSTLGRSARSGVYIEDHKAGFKVLNEEGSYYVYALPAYNLKEVENLFSVEEPNNAENENMVNIVMNSAGDEVDYRDPGITSEQFISKTTKSPYAHSYMLTSVQGADYVDLQNDGPSDDDLGYWVKFDYTEYAGEDDAYQWRAPYLNHKAQYHRNDAYTSADDKASYQYGEKELWYLSRIETKSHIAVFITEERTDNEEAVGEYPNSTNATVQHGVRLKEIRVYEKKAFESYDSNNPSADPTPLQTIIFNHGYRLCPDTENSGAPMQKKLTLESITFNSLGSTRGDLNQYKFDYAELDLLIGAESSILGLAPEGINPSYAPNSYDPWGTYKPRTTSFDFDSHFPYTNQFNQGWGSMDYSAYPNETDAARNYTQRKQDERASAWCLNQIQLPSGGVIDIHYESDDYGYVQHKTAAQMFKIAKMGDFTNPNELYGAENENNLYHNESSLDDEKRRRIYFRLEYPIKTSEPMENVASQIKETYVDPLITDESGARNLYFKTKMKLTQSTPGSGIVWDYVSGYLKLESALSKTDGVATKYNYGVYTGADIDGDPATFTDAGVEYYRYGYVTVEPARKKNVGFFDQYHPMALAGWTHLQTNAQELLHNPNSFNSGDPNTDNVAGEIVDLFNVMPQLLSSFGAIRKYCKMKNMAREIELDRSCIRLASPDKRKFGGGHRVKDIMIRDNWGADIGSGISQINKSRTYGQHYEYTMEENGEIISSGVAQYEPQAGGDENALKYPVYFFGKNTLFTRNNLFTEAPLNEALFPGAQVGYRQVTVTTLNTDKQEKAAQQTSPSAVGRTGGVTVHEFYTSKDFPTMTEHTTLSESNNTRGVFNLPIPIPFIGSIKRNYYHGTQAYLIETNDMHGKPKATRTYEMSNYERNGNPITESTYEYQADPVNYQGETVFKLNNEVEIIANDGTHKMSDTKKRMGVDVDLFTDQRESMNSSTSVGLAFGMESLTQYPAIVAPEIWPSFTNHKSIFRTYVTNKVVHRSGILKRTKSRDLQTVNETEVLAYDETSGSPLLTKVKNEFGDDFYSYNIPAYYHYDRMGHAYRNINYIFKVSGVNATAGAGNVRSAVIEAPASNEMLDYLVRGDELLIIDSNDPNTKYLKGYFLGWQYPNSSSAVNAKIVVLGIASSLSGLDLTFKVIRSGRRNHYGTMAANYLTKGELDIIDPNTNDIDYEDLVDQQNVNSGVQTPKIQKNVLSATASLFKDDWGTSGPLNIAGASTTNPFLSGNSGIWRPYKSYTYVGDRKGSASMDDNTTSDPDLANDGVMDNVEMFTWDIGDMEQYVSNWEWVNEVTRFSPDAYELENVNRLGIYSSALYGYDNSLTIAVGGNASMHEIGVCDFETSEVGSAANAGGYKGLMGQTNMNFDLTHASAGDALFMAEQFNILSAESMANNQLLITTNIPYSYYSANTFEQNMGLTLVSRETGVLPKNEGYYFNGKFVSAVDQGGFTVFTVTPFIDNDGQVENMVEVGTKHHGKIVLLQRRALENTPRAAEYVTNKTHTGRKSMKVTGTSLFDQPMLKLNAGKKYVWSMWVSRDAKMRTFDPQDENPNATPFFRIGKMNAGSFLPYDPNGPSMGLTVDNISFSKVIEGWQKVDVEFELNEDNPILAIEFNPGAEPLYVDDIRFSPRTGGITTYVYDASRFWLRASLNVDNYATLFFYDEEGNLTIKKQETEEGIFTITESRGHVSEEN